METHMKTLALLVPDCTLTTKNSPNVRGRMGYYNRSVETVSLCLSPFFVVFNYLLDVSGHQPLASGCVAPKPIAEYMVLKLKHASNTSHWEGKKEPNFNVVFANHNWQIPLNQPLIKFNFDTKLDHFSVHWNNTSAEKPQSTQTKYTLYIFLTYFYSKSPQTGIN